MHVLMRLNQHFLPSSSEGSHAAARCKVFACGGPAKVHGDVPWIRVGVLDNTNDVLRHCRVVRDRIGSLINGSLLSLERLSTGVLSLWKNRHFSHRCSVSLDSIADLPSKKGRDILQRLNAFWRDFDRRFEFDAVGSANVAVKHPNKCISLEIWFHT